MSAVVVVRWTGAEATALRLALRMTQEGFAAHLGLATRTVALWRARPGRPLSPVSAALLDTVWARADEATRARFAELTGTGTGGMGGPVDVRAELAAMAAQVEQLAVQVARLAAVTAPAAAG